MKTEARIPELDGYRGVAVMSIVVLHYVVHHLHVPPGTWPAYAQKYLMSLWIGVDAFFVLSGYLIVGILMDRRISSNYFRVFYIRRSLRIFPPYFLLLGCWLLASQALCAVPGMRWLLEPRIEAWPYLIYIQNFWMAAIGHTGPNFVAATWSLAVEEQFYLLLPLLVFLLRPRALPWVLAVGVVLAPALRACLAAAGPELQEAQTRLLPTRWDSLLLGALVAWCVRQPELVAKSLRHRRSLQVLLALLAASVAAIPFALNAPHAFSSPWRAFAVYLVVASFFALVLFMLHVGELPTWRRVLSLPPLRFLGTISYFVYLFHTAVLGLAFALLLGKEPGLESAADWLVMALAFVTVIAFASASWRWMEGPLVSLGHRFQYDSSTRFLQASLPGDAIAGGPKS